MPTRTELIWDGKYDANGKRVAPVRVALPFQTIETVNESAQDRERNLFQLAAQEQPWRNRLIWGDKKYVLPSLLPEFAGKVNLIYIDPPFDTGADFSFTAAIPDTDDEEESGLVFTKQPSIIEQKAYRDTWGRGIDSYLQWFYETAVLLHELLAENGSLYVHIGPGIGSYVRVLLEEIFGSNVPSAELCWKRVTTHGDSKRWGIIHDFIIWHAKSTEFSWNSQYEPYSAAYLGAKYTYSTEDGRKYRLDNMTAAGSRRGESGGPVTINGQTFYLPPGRHWAIGLRSGETVQQAMDRLFCEGRIDLPKKKDGRPQLRRFLDEMPGTPVGTVWTDIPPVNSQAKEDTGYDTQKPEALLERILKASSNEGDLVLDCFCGSGTTAAVAEKLNRRWIACDLGRFGIHTTRKRLLLLPGVRPFVVQNLGKYERQLWQTGQFARDGPETPEQAAKRHRAYIEFILKLYGATPLNGYTWLHGTRGGRLVHVGSVEAPVSTGDVSRIAAEFKKAIGTGKDAPTTNGVDVLGWDFAFELHEVAAQQAAAANIRMNFKRIPRDVMDKRAVEQGDIKFFELAALGVEAKVKGRDMTFALTEFVIPPDDVPEEVRTAVKHWSQWIDYWAVDWDHKGDTFHNEWQTFRTRKDGRLSLTTAHTYAEPGEYRVVVKVIDILGNDTTKTVKVKVK